MKKYRNYLKNQKLRKENPNVRRVINGKPSTFWSQKNVNERPVGAF